MRTILALVLLCSGCGALSSGAGAPANPPASGLGPVIPIEDQEGLSWTPPFLLADPALAFSHPSALVDENAIRIWVQSDKGGERTIATARAETFELGMGPLEEALRAEAAWEAGAVGSPSVLRSGDATLLLYVAEGKIGCARLDAGRAVARAATPVYAEVALRSIAFGQVGEHVRGYGLGEDGGLYALEGELDLLLQATRGGSASLRARPVALPTPSWGLAYTELGLRLERTPAGRLREDVFLATTLPSAMDLGGEPPPTAIGAAARYLEEGVPEPPLELVANAVLTGPPSPGSATAVSYRGGVLVLYSARSGPRPAIGVGRHP